MLSSRPTPCRVKVSGPAFSGRAVGEIHVEAGAFAPAAQDQAADHVGRQAFCGIPGNGLPVTKRLAQRDRGDAEQHAGHRRAHRSREYRFDAEIRAAVDAGQDQVGRASRDEMPDAHDDAIARRAQNRKPPLAFWTDPQAANAGLWSGRCRSGRVRERPPRFRGRGTGATASSTVQARCLDPVVVGQQDAPEDRIGLLPPVSLRFPP